MTGYHDPARPIDDGPDFDVLRDECVSHAIGTWGYDPARWPAELTIRAEVSKWLREDGANAAEVSSLMATGWESFAMDMQTEAAAAARDVLDDELADEGDRAHAAEVLALMGYEVAALAEVADLDFDLKESRENAA